MRNENNLLVLKEELCLPEELHETTYCLLTALNPPKLVRPIHLIQRPYLFHFTVSATIETARIDTLAQTSLSKQRSEVDVNFPNGLIFSPNALNDLSCLLRDFKVAAEQF